LFGRVDERSAARQVRHTLLLLEEIERDLLVLLEVHAVFDGVRVSQYEQPQSIIGYGHIRGLSARLQRGYWRQGLLRKTRVRFEQTRGVFLGQDEDRAIGVHGHAFGIVRAVWIPKLQPVSGLHDVRKSTYFVDDNNVDRFSLRVVIADVANVEARRGRPIRAWPKAHGFGVFRVETRDPNGPCVTSVAVGDVELADVAGVIDLIEPPCELPGHGESTGLA